MWPTLKKSQKENGQKGLYVHLKTAVYQGMFLVHCGGSNVSIMIVIQQNYKMQDLIEKLNELFVTELFVKVRVGMEGEY